MRGSSSSSHALWCTFASLCACDHTLLGGDWIFSLHLGHQWLDESMSESLILVGRSTKLHVACSRAHTFTHTLTVWDPDVSSFFFKFCIWREACGLHGTGPSSLLMGRFSPHSFHSDISFVRPPSPSLFHSHSTHAHTRTHTSCVRWSQQGLEALCNRPERNNNVF